MDYIRSCFNVSVYIHKLHGIIVGLVTSCRPILIGILIVLPPVSVVIWSLALYGSYFPEVLTF